MPRRPWCPALRRPANCRPPHLRVRDRGPRTLKIADGGWAGQSCAIGPAGFPAPPPPRCRRGGFPLRGLCPVALGPERQGASPGPGSAGWPLRSHRNPRPAPEGQPRGFPYGPRMRPSLCGSEDFRPWGPGAGGPPPPWPCPLHAGGRFLPRHFKAGYAARRNSTCRLLPRARVPEGPERRVSAGVGSTPACHCGSPVPLNSQQQPPAGRRKPPPGTSSVCPAADF